MTIAALFAAGMIAAQSGAPQSFDVRAGPAAQSVNQLATQAGIDVAIVADLDHRRAPAIRGRMTVEVALDRVLRPLGARAVRIGATAYRVEAIPHLRAGFRPPLPRTPDTDAIAPVQLSEVVVTAMPPVGLSGANGRGLLDSGALQRVEGSAASDAISDLTATVDSTRQGAGRNKLFVRGLADSAMNGPLQATVGQYFGDLRLSYGSPHPDISLIDIGRIEVFEGPQGARFGAGSIGGVLRVQPQPPVMGEASGRIILGGGATSGGGPSGDTAVVLNQPMGDRLALRVVGYARHEGGFLDNPEQDRREADAVDTVGGRAAVRWTNDVWTVDLTALGQSVEAGDAQTVHAGRAGFVKSGQELEPYDSSIALIGVSATRRLGRARLTSATSVSRQVLAERFDATAPTDPFDSVVDRRQIIRTLSSELRLEGDQIAGWTLSGGAALAIGETVVERRRRDLSPDPQPTYGVDLTRTFAEGAVFGEAAISPAPDWRFALGARLSAVRIDSDIQGVEAAGIRLAKDWNGVSVQVTPSLSARWDATPDATIFARLDQSVRPAGVNEANGAFARYHGDRVTLVELGARSRNWRHDLSGEVSVGWMDWRDVQADIVTPGGDLVTDNVGDGTIGFVSIKAAWRVTETLDVSGGLFLNESRLTPTRFSIIGGGSTEIPNVAPIGAQLSLDYLPGQIGGMPLRLGADLRYVGGSRLGVGPALDVPQGGYLQTDLTARLGGEGRAWTLRVSNPLDGGGIRYGIGSPYQLSELQVVPVRPLSVRIGFEASF